MQRGLPGPRVACTQVSSSALGGFGAPVATLTAWPVVAPVVGEIAFPFAFYRTGTVDTVVSGTPTVTTAIDTGSPVDPELLGTAPPELPSGGAAGTAPVLTPRLVPGARNPTGKFLGAIYVYGPLASGPTPTADTIAT